MTSWTSPSAVSGVTDSFAARDLISSASARCSVTSCCANFFTAGLVAFFAASWLSRTSPALFAPMNPRTEASVHPPRLATLPAAESIRRAAVSAAAPTRLAAVSAAAPTRLAVVSVALSAALRSFGVQAQSVRTTAAVPRMRPFVPDFMGPPFFPGHEEVEFAFVGDSSVVQDAFFGGGYLAADPAALSGARQRVCATIPGVHQADP